MALLLEGVLSGQPEKVTYMFLLLVEAALADLLAKTINDKQTGMMVITRRSEVIRIRRIE